MAASFGTFGSVWVPSERLHTLRELQKLARALSKRRSYLMRPYCHVQGKVSGTMRRDLYETMRGEILAQGLPVGVANVESYYRRAYFRPLPAPTEAERRAAIEAEHFRMIEECAEVEAA